MRLQIRTKTLLEAAGKFISGEDGLMHLEAIEEFESIQRGTWAAEKIAPTHLRLS